MIKKFASAGWDLGVQLAWQVPFSSRGLRGTDRGVFSKRASGSEGIFLPFLDKVTWHPGEIAAHNVALGITEKYSANRNGDGFREKMARECHKTYETDAHFFKNHKNKKHKGDPHYGEIKLAAYNPVMGRIELLLGLYGTKEAADRGGGLVSESALEKLARGQLETSMAVYVPYDNCSACDNQARNRDEYCRGECPGGGCFDNLGRVVKYAGDMHHLHVDNRVGRFFDISEVVRNADPTSWAYRADYLAKQASLAAEEYADSGSPDLPPLETLLRSLDPTLDPAISSAVKIAYGLADLEKAGRRLPSFRQTRLSEMRPAELRKMAASGILLTAEEYCGGRDAKHAAEAVRLVPGAASRSLADGLFAERLDRIGLHDAPAPRDKAASQLVASRSLLREPSYVRSALAAVRGNGDNDISKLAAVPGKGPAEELAREYAAYRASALAELAEHVDADELYGAAARSLA